MSLGLEVSNMSWRPTYRSSKFRNVYGKVANREHCFDGIPITKNVHDNHFCAVNSKFLAVVTESAGGGSFISRINADVIDNEARANSTHSSRHNHGDGFNQTLQGD
ncbi:unnamed protein product [Menidia menidia]|uniref:(Atlantic silverside) hypothetical protein n=1 Tax=Menidia menidia TaxID=238744 RepID=A0A8S4A7G4_9TELE|nr:unnamed protein product [Menidia menidia]